MLKLKFSVGQQGNDNIGDYAYIDLYELVRSSDTLHVVDIHARG